MGDHDHPDSLRCLRCSVETTCLYYSFSATVIRIVLCQHLKLSGTYEPGPGHPPSKKKPGQRSAPAGFPTQLSSSLQQGLDHPFPGGFVAVADDRMLDLAFFVDDKAEGDATALVGRNILLPFAVQLA